MLATGWTPIYPCHVTPAQMRQHPIGTGPFKFVEFKPNQSIRVTRNPDYWKPGRPYLDGIEYRIIKDVSTRLLSFIAGNEDVYFGVTMPQLKDVKTKVPQAICDMTIPNVARNLLVNRDVPPFDNPELRRAMSLTIDRQAFVDIIAEGQGAIGGVMQPPPEGIWGMPPYAMRNLPGYDPDVASSRAKARKIMEKLGYGPDNRLKVTVSTRNLAPYRDPAVVLIDQLKQIYIDAELNPIDTTQWYPTLMRKDYKVGMNVTETAVDDPDVAFYENYMCGSQRNYTGYCNPEIDKLDGPAIGGVQLRETQETGVGDRAQTDRGRCASDPLLHARGELPRTVRQGPDHDGQQHLQRLAFRGPLARQLTAIHWVQGAVVRISRLGERRKKQSRLLQREGNHMKQDLRVLAAVGLLCCRCQWARGICAKAAAFQCHITLMVNSIYNGSRFEDRWLDQ